MFFVASLRYLQARGLPFVFADRHAIMHLARFSTSLDDLGSLAWKHWQERDFRRDPNDPEKTERYQAEALVHRHLPTEQIDAIVCGTTDTKANRVALRKARVTEMVHNRHSQIEVVSRKLWFF